MRLSNGSTGACGRIPDYCHRGGARVAARSSLGGVSVLGRRAGRGVSHAHVRPSPTHAASMLGYMRTSRSGIGSNPAATFWSGVSGSANHGPHFPPILRTCPSSGIAAPSSYPGSAGAPSNAGRVDSLGYFLLSWGEVGTGSPDRIALMTQRPSSPPAESCCSTRTRP